jgi:hypothetical protein
VSTRGVDGASLLHFFLHRALRPVPPTSDFTPSLAKGRGGEDSELASEVAANEVRR